VRVRRAQVCVPGTGVFVRLSRRGTRRVRVSRRLVSIACVKVGRVPGGILTSLLNMSRVLLVVVASLVVVLTCSLVVPVLTMGIASGHMGGGGVPVGMSGVEVVVRS